MWKPQGWGGLGALAHPCIDQVGRQSQWDSDLPKATQGVPWLSPLHPTTPACVVAEAWGVCGSHVWLWGALIQQLR